MTTGPVHFESLTLVDHPFQTSHSPSTGGVDETIFNPALIAIAIIYVLWSWVHLPSSIWFRSLLACYLIWRMKPDIIIPFVLSCVQLRLQLGQGVNGDDLQSTALQMTGFEQYAFMIPCVLYFIRTFVAALSARVVRRAQFPFWLYNIYLVGMLFVLVGAISAYGKPAWTAAVRDYCVVGLYFYGLLMPACSKHQLMRLAAGFAVLGALTVMAHLLMGYHSRQLWVLLPVAGSFLPLLFCGGGSLVQLTMAATYSVLGFGFAGGSTFTVLLLYAWNTIAGVGLGAFGGRSLRSAMVTSLTYGLLAMTLCMFFYGAFKHDPTRELHDAMKAGDGSTIGRMTYKLCGDRGPIWWGAMLELVNNPTACGTPAPQFMIRSHNKDSIWPYSTHSILMDPLLRLGIVAGPILLLVLFHAVMVSRNAVARESDIGIAVLGLAVISNIVLGGATLPYMLNERAAEHMHMVAGLLGVYGLRTRLVRPGQPSVVRQEVVYPHSLPAA